MTTRLRWAEQYLQYHFENAELLELALTHRSASKSNNERLEFLGDSFLNFAIARRLYELHPYQSEGDLSRLRAAVVRGATLAEVGRELALGPHIILGPGENSSGETQRDSIIANAIEAVIGAVLLDGGYDAADACISHLFFDRLEQLPDADSLKDAKTKLQEWLQGRGLDLPVYTVVSVSGEPHRQTFVVMCEIGDTSARAEGCGQSRRRAEQDAAEQMLSILNSDDKR